MSFNLRGTNPAVIADGSITEEKLANNAVTADKIASDAVTESKIVNGLVTETKVATDAITLEKVTGEITMQHFLGSEVELSHSGDVETTIAEFNFNTSAVSEENFKRIIISGAIKSNDAGNASEVQLYIDGNILFGPLATTTATIYEVFVVASSSLPDLTAGKHLVEVKALNSTPTGITSINQLDVYLALK